VIRVNFHEDTPLRERLRPLGTPELVLLDSADTTLYRWFGFTEAEEFDAVLKPLCSS
jgi:hypothetical protein